MHVLEKNEIWELVSLPAGNKIVGCPWVYIVKLIPDETLTCLKAHLVAKWYPQTYGVDYQDTFSPIAKMISVRLLIWLATTLHWTLRQLDIKNAFSMFAKITLWLETIPSSLVWEIWLRHSGVWSSSFLERSLDFLSHSSGKTYSLSSLRGWHCNYRRWCTRD